jgi:hypothetical protein
VKNSRAGRNFFGIRGHGGQNEIFNHHCHFCRSPF